MFDFNFSSSLLHHVLDYRFSSLFVISNNRTCSSGAMVLSGFEEVSLQKKKLKYTYVMSECWYLQFSKINFNAVLTRSTCIDGPLLCGIEISVYSPWWFYVVDFFCWVFFVIVVLWEAGLEIHF